LLCQKLVQKKEFYQYLGKNGGEGKKEDEAMKKDHFERKTHFLWPNVDGRTQVFAAVAGKEKKP